MKDITHLFASTSPAATAPAVMTEASMEATTPPGHYAVFRYRGVLVDVCRVTPDPVEANALYRAGIDKPGSRRARATVHLFARPL